MTPTRHLRPFVALLMAGCLHGAFAQRMSAAPDCLVVSGGTGAKFSDAKIDAIWLEINRQVSANLFTDLRENGYAARQVFTEAVDRDAQPSKALAAVARSGCGQLLQVSHQVDEDADGSYFAFDISLLRFVRVEDGGPPTPGSQTKAVSDFHKTYRHPRTTEEMDKFHTGTFANEVFSDLRASRAIEVDFSPDPDSTVVHQAYDRVIAAQPKGIEAHVRHILVPDEAQARAAIARIQHGEQFGVVAREMSIDTGSRDKGGDLDWARSAAYVPEFAHAVEAHAPKGFDPDPVRTQFGWHVIEVLETRAARFPSFDDVKVRLATTLKARHDEAMKAKAP
jgi:parvulin-like peptidyl-prolyl isomerase